MKLVILGQIPSLKNSVKVYQNRVYTDPKTKDFMDEAKAELKTQWKRKPLEQADNLTCVFYHKDARPRDIPNELDTVADILKGIVIKDDNMNCLPSIQLQYGGIDKKCPRAEIWVDFNE